MSNYSFNDDRKSIDTVLARLSKNPHLSDWEKRFITNIKEYHGGGGFLSDRQSQTLSDLWAKY